MLSTEFYKKSVLGYNKQQVDIEVMKYEDQIHLLNERLAIAKEENNTLIKKNNVLQKEVQMVKREIQVKDNAMREMSKIAISEANHLVNSASKNADIIVTEALSTARRILLELTYTARMNNELKSNLKAQIDGIISKIDKFETVELPDLRWLVNYEKSND